MTSDYKKYSLDKLQEWVHDAMNSDASPHEIYSAIREAVREDYYYHKDCISRATGLLELMSGHRPVANSNDAWEEHYYPEEYQYTATGEKFPLQYTEEELNAMCDKAASDEEKEKCQEYNIREEEYYNKKTELDAEIEEIRKEGGYDWTPPVSEQKSDHYYNYTRNDINRKNPFETQNGVTYTEYTKAKIEVNSAWNDGWTKQHYQEIVDKYEGKQPKKWVLPVEQFAGSEEYLISFPDDLLKEANLKEGDEVEWVDQGDGSYLLKKHVER